MRTPRSPSAEDELEPVVDERRSGKKAVSVRSVPRRLMDSTKSMLDVARGVPWRSIIWMDR